MAEQSPRNRLLSTATALYNPIELADSMLTHLEHMETESDATPQCDQYRKKTGLICAPEFRGYKKAGDVENAISEWLAEYYTNASSQARDLVRGAIPDIVFAFKSNDSNDGVLVFLEAKPVWITWITTGEKPYAGVSPDEYGRCTYSYDKGGNIQQVVSDRDKLLGTYTDPNDRHLLLALVFQRPDELDEQLITAVGPGWSCRKRHILDRCNPPGDNIGVTGMVFWPDHES